MSVPKNCICTINDPYGYCNEKNICSSCNLTRGDYTYCDFIPNKNSCTQKGGKWCDLGSECHTELGWNWNSNKTKCNIFACTKDGNKMDPNKPENNADDLYDFKDGKCWRKGPGDVAEDHCQHSGGILPGFCIKHEPKMRKDWKNWQCDGTDPWKCEAHAVDKTPIIKSKHGLPEYMYPEYDGEDANSWPSLCWKTNPNRKYSVNFSLKDYITPGEQPSNCPKDGF